MAEQPLVSVVMTTYNGAALLRETIDSILQQTFTDFELIIVDDCSQDDTVAVIDSYHDPRINLFRNEQNLGISRTRNRGLQLAKGEFIAATDQDDISLPERLERQVAFLKSNPEVVLVATAAKELRDGVIRSKYFVELPHFILHWMLFTRSQIVHSSICFRRQTQRHYGIEYNNDYAFAEDLYLFHRFAQAGAIVSLPDELMVYREHPGNNSSRHSRLMNENGKRFLLSHYRDYLGVDVSADDISALWRLFNHGRPVADQSQLLYVGKLYSEALLAFQKATGLSDSQCLELQRWAAGEWWRVVSDQAIMGKNYSLLRAFQQIELLSAEKPNWRNYFRVLAKLIIPIPLLGLLRDGHAWTK